MRRIVHGVGLLLIVVWMTACADVVPPARIEAYLTPEHRVGADGLIGIEKRPVKAGLLVVSDTAAAGAAPNLPDEAFVRMTERLQQDLGRAIPLTITEVLTPDTIKPKPNGDWTEFEGLGRQRGFDYLAVVVLSSTEQEYPVTLYLGDYNAAEPGFRRDNWSLMEFALLDLKRGRAVIEADGRGWATLDSPTAPAINQWYPVVYLRPQDPERHFWPPTFEGAPLTLRVVSFDQAENRLKLKLRKIWTNQLESALSAKKPY